MNICDTMFAISSQIYDIGVRFNNLLLFNLVFSLPLGDEIEPVQRDVKLLSTYVRIPFSHIRKIHCYATGISTDYKGCNNVLWVSRNNSLGCGDYLVIYNKTANVRCVNVHYVISKMIHESSLSQKAL